jgi:hypothetical protein
MFFEFLNAVINLDIAWLAGLLFNNIHYLFAFVAILFFFFEGKTKSIAIGFFVFCLVAWAFQDFESTSGWIYFAGGFLFLNYLLKIASLTFAESVPGLSKHMLVVNFISAYALLVAYNIFVV